MPSISAETAVALAIGIPSVLFAAITLWVTYRTWLDSRQPRGKHPAKKKKKKKVEILKLM